MKHWLLIIAAMAAPGLVNAQQLRPIVTCQIPMINESSSFELKLELNRNVNPWEMQNTVWINGGSLFELDLQGKFELIPDNEAIDTPKEVVGFVVNDPFTNLKITISDLVFEVPMEKVIVYLGYRTDNVSKSYRVLTAVCPVTY